MNWLGTGAIVAFEGIDVLLIGDNDLRLTAATDRAEFLCGVTLDGPLQPGNA